VRPARKFNAEAGHLLRLLALLVDQFEDLKKTPLYRSTDDYVDLQSAQLALKDLAQFSDKLAQDLWHHLYGDTQ